MVINHGFLQVRHIPQQQRISVTGVIYKKEYKGEDGVYYLKDVNIRQIRDEQVYIHLNRVMVRVPSREYRIGEIISFESNMRWMEQASNKGGFDERTYYHSLGVDTYLYCQQLPTVLEQRKACALRNGLCTFREQIRQVFVENLNDKDAGILSAMVLGDKSLMEDEIKQLYSGAGISHILAVSGLHVSMIGMTFFSFLRKHRQKYLVSCLGSGVVLMLFCIMSGMSVSAMRAGIMFLLFLGAQLLGRKYHPLRALIVAAGITLLVNPCYVYNAGFLFSYFAVFGAVAVAPIFRKKLSICFSAAILMTTMPLTAFFYYEIPLYSILANLVVIPLAGVVMGCGLLGGLIGSLLPSVGWIFFVPCHWILRLYEGICHGLQLLPADLWITGRPPWWLMIVYYGLLVFMVWMHHKKKKVYGSIFLLALLCLVVMFCLPPSRQFQIHFLDVGQGDGIYINGGDGKQYFVDGGSTSENEVGRYTILPFLKYHRIREIDVWFVSHPDTDHISGLIEALKYGYEIETIVISECAVENENLRMLKQMAWEYNTDIVSINNGAYIQGEDYRILCYTPKAEDEEDTNQASLVNLVWYEPKDYRILLTGDIGANQELWLLAQPEVRDIDVLKAAHHGSKYSSCEEFLQKISPEITIISCGENNGYGHPHTEAIERIKNAGSDVLLTMETGEITIRK